MQKPFTVIGLAALGIAGLLAISYFWPGERVLNSRGRSAAGTNAAGEKSMAERIAEAEVRSARVRGVYMTSEVANDQGRAATKLRNDILELLATTELNAVVIDVKEVTGGLVITDRLKNLLTALRQKGIWTIARMVVFKDDSQLKAHADWYLKKKSGGLWRDNRGGLWMDPASPTVWDYTVKSAQQAAAAGFDEIQFDYIRFPSDGNVRIISYPVYNPAEPKHEVLKKFFSYLRTQLKQERPDIILSADFFGYVALQKEDIGIGQRLEDIGENFDYLSLMVYPSHYYQGFEVYADSLRNLPELYYPYRSQDALQTAVSHPYEVVYRTLLTAKDILDGRSTTTKTLAASRATSTLLVAQTSAFQELAALPHAKLRPWLQDFDLAVDSARGIHYDATKVRAQIEAAERAGASGWLLWSADNVYTKEVLKPKGEP